MEREPKMPTVWAIQLITGLPFCILVLLQKLGLYGVSPPSDEGGGKTAGFDGGREKVKIRKNATFSLPQSRYAQQPLTAAVPSVTS